MEEPAGRRSIRRPAVRFAGNEPTSARRTGQPFACAIGL